MHNIKMPKNIHSSVNFLKHDIITLKIRFIEPLHDKTSALDFAHREDPDQPEHSPTLIRVFTVRTENSMNGHLLPIERTARTLIRQSDPSLRWAYSCFCWFFHIVALLS